MKIAYLTHTAVIALLLSILSAKLHGDIAYIHPETRIEIPKKIAEYSFLQGDFSAEEDISTTLIYGTKRSESAHLIISIIEDEKSLGQIIGNQIAYLKENSKKSMETTEIGKPVILSESIRYFSRKFFLYSSSTSGVGKPRIDRIYISKVGNYRFSFRIIDKANSSFFRGNCTKFEKLLPKIFPSRKPIPTTNKSSSERISENSIFVISPFKKDKTWVFNDPQRKLQEEPFVAGVPQMIDWLTRDIPNAQKGFRMTFASTPFPGFELKLKKTKTEYGGTWYAIDGKSHKGWLCPALFKYYKEAPDELYIKADPSK